MSTRDSVWRCTAAGSRGGASSGGRSGKTSVVQARWGSLTPWPGGGPQGHEGGRPRVGAGGSRLEVRTRSSPSEKIPYILPLALWACLGG